MNNDALTCVLHELAEVRSGHPFRGAISAVPNGSVGVVQIGDLSRAGLKDCDGSGLVRTELEGRKAPDWLRDQDVLLVARGAHIYAACLVDPPPRTVCSPHLYVIRVQQARRLLPAFLAWQLNQPPAQRYLRQSAEGSHQLSVRRTLLEQTPICLPSIEQQRLIMSLERAAQAERLVLQALIQNRETELSVIAEQLLGPSALGH